MTSDEIHALSGAYAVDALDDVERARFEKHLAACAECQAEVTSLREAAGTLAELTTAPPSHELRARVLAGIELIRPLPPIVAERQVPAEGTSEPAARHLAPVPVDAPSAAPQAPTYDGRTPPARVVPLRRRRRLTALLAAAAAVVAIGGGGAVWQATSHDPQPVNAADRVIDAPDHQTVDERLQDGATVAVYRSKQLNQAVLVTHDLPAAPSGMQYVLWLRHGTTMVAAGVLPHAADNKVVLSGDAASADGAGITLERSGVEPTAPSGQTVALMAFQDA